MNEVARAKLLTLLLLLGGCAAGTAQAPAPVQEPRAAPYSVVGLETVIGRNARFLETQFGRPELDVREGTARKLQFASPVCVLDAYLYPPKAGAEPIVTHVDAREPDGDDFDRASCVAALQAQKQRR